MNERTQNTFRFICKLIAAFFITIAVFMTYPSGIVIVTAMLYRLFDSQSMIMLIGCTLAIIVFICRGCFAFPRMKNDIKNHYKQDSESAIRIKSVIFFCMPMRLKHCCDDTVFHVILFFQLTGYRSNFCCYRATPHLVPNLETG